MQNLPDEFQAALRNDRTIDIVTTGVILGLASFRCKRHRHERDVSFVVRWWLLRPRNNKGDRYMLGVTQLPCETGVQRT